jgi:rod shape-determining protein MreC
MVAVVASIVLMSVDHRANHLESTRGLLSTMLYPLQLAIHLPIRTGEWLSEQLSMRRTILAENAQLREERLRIRTRLEKLGALEAENRRLRKLLGSSERVTERVLVAELISVDMDPFSRRIVLNKGAQDGVSPGQALIGTNGVMGQIIHVGPFTSNALLITDPSHALPVQIHRNGLRSVALGTGPLNLLKLSYIPNNADVRVDDHIVTSGLGSRFLSGYPVGKVVEIRRDQGQPFAEVYVEPSAMLERTREVLLVRSDSAASHDPAFEAYTSWSGW